MLNGWVPRRTVWPDWAILKILVTNFLAKVAYIIWNFLDFWKRHFLSKNYCGHFRHLFQKWSMFLFSDIWSHWCGEHPSMVCFEVVGTLIDCLLYDPPRFSWPPWSGCRTRTGSLPPPWRPPTRGTVLSPKTVNIWSKLQLTRSLLCIDI